MKVRRTPGSVDRGSALDTFTAEGCSTPRFWSNGPGDRYGLHEHAFHKVLFCLSGSITFHTDESDVELTSGDRLDLPAGTPHSARVGSAGCECVEASR